MEKLQETLQEKDKTQINNYLSRKIKNHMMNVSYKKYLKSPDLLPKLKHIEKSISSNRRNRFYINNMTHLINRTKKQIEDWMFISTAFGNDSVVSKSFRFPLLIESILKFFPMVNNRFENVPTDKIEKQLSVIDKSFFSNPNKKILIPDSGIGNYQAVLIAKLMVGLTTTFPVPEDRYKHIIENMIYVTSSDLTCLHIYKTMIDMDDKLEQNVYPSSFLSKDFIYHMKDVWEVEKFDLVCGFTKQYNTRGKNYTSYFDKYFKKIFKHDLAEKISLLTIDKWLYNGVRVSDFRKDIFNRTDIKNIDTYDNIKDFFDNDKRLDGMKGGLCSVYIDTFYNGKSSFNDVSYKNINKYDIIVDSKYHKILDKMLNHNFLKGDLFLSDICKSNEHFGIDKKLLKSEKSDNDLRVFVSKSDGWIKYISPEYLVNKHNKAISGYKLFTSSYNTLSNTDSFKKNGLFGVKIIGMDNDICYSTYITHTVKSRKEAINLKHYLNTNFAQFFLSLRKNTHHINKAIVSWIPMVDLSVKWTDESLYKEFGYSEYHIHLIEDRVTEWITDKNI